ncbi:hypothetical protein GGF43_005527, partial [Coemansia sp. RSA 2618]
MSLLASTSRVSSQETLQGEIAQGYRAEPTYASEMDDGAFLLTARKKKAPYRMVAKEELGWLTES